MEKNDLSIINKYRVPLMGFAALWIYLYHEQAYEWWHVYFSPEIISRTAYFFKRIGFCGVDIFLLISGVGLVYAIEKHSLSVFFKRRIERVVIPFFVMGIILAFVEKWSLLTFLRKVFLYDFLFVDVLSLLWYVPAILILYLVFPIYYHFFKKSPTKYRFTFIFVLIWLILTLLLKDIIRHDMYRFINRIPIFFSGILLAWHIREKNFSFNNIFWLILGVILAVGIFLEFLTTSRSVFLLVPMSNFCIPAFLVGISLTVFLAKFFSLLDKIHIGKWILKAFSFIGSISLEIYCVQDLIDDTVRTMMMVSYEHWMENWWKIDIGVFLCVILGAVILSYISLLIRKSLEKIFSKHQLSP